MYFLPNGLLFGFIISTAALSVPVTPNSQQETAYETSARSAPAEPDGAIEGIVQIASQMPSDRNRVSGRYQRRPGSQSQQDPDQAILIWIENENHAADIPSDEPVVLDQMDLQFKPDLLAVRQFETVRIHNSDPVYHNVFSFSQVKRFDVGRRPQGESYDVVFERQGVVDVFCDLHSNMHAVIYVVSPATVDWMRIAGNESFRFSALNDGTYTLNIYTSGFDLYSTTVEVRGDTKQLGSIVLTP